MNLKISMLLSVALTLILLPVFTSAWNQKQGKTGYSFSYGINDKHYGSDYDRQENSDGKTVKGSYTIQLPDGRKQIVNYEADHENGYTAKISYEGEALFPPPTKREPFIVKPNGQQYTKPESNYPIHNGRVPSKSSGSPIAEANYNLEQSFEKSPPPIHFNSKPPVHNPPTSHRYKPPTIERRPHKPYAQKHEVKIAPSAYKPPQRPNKPALYSSPYDDGSNRKSQKPQDKHQSQYNPDEHLPNFNKQTQEHQTNFGKPEFETNFEDQHSFQFDPKKQPHRQDNNAFISGNNLHQQQSFDQNKQDHLNGVSENLQDFKLEHQPPTQFNPNQGGPPHDFINANEQFPFPSDKEQFAPQSNFHQQEIKPNEQDLQFEPERNNQGFPLGQQHQENVENGNQFHGPPEGFEPSSDGFNFHDASQPHPTDSFNRNERPPHLANDLNEHSGFNTEHQELPFDFNPDQSTGELPHNLLQAQFDDKPPPSKATFHSHHTTPPFGLHKQSQSPQHANIESPKEFTEDLEKLAPEFQNLPDERFQLLQNEGELDEFLKAQPHLSSPGQHKSFREQGDERPHFEHLKSEGPHDNFGNNGFTEHNFGNGENFQTKPQDVKSFSDYDQSLGTDEVSEKDFQQQFSPENDLASKQVQTNDFLIPKDQFSGNPPDSELKHADDFPPNFDQTNFNDEKDVHSGKSLQNPHAPDFTSKQTDFAPIDHGLNNARFPQHIEQGPQLFQRSENIHESPIHTAKGSEFPEENKLESRNVSDEDGAELKLKSYQKLDETLVTRQTDQDSSKTTYNSDTKSKNRFTREPDDENVVPKEESSKKNDERSSGEKTR